MATDLFKLSYRRRLFLLLLVFAWALIAIFVVFQYEREKDYKAEQLNSLLQYYNRQLGNAIADRGFSPDTVGRLAAPMPDTRVSVIDIDGNVVFDNTIDSLANVNHLDRPEVRRAVDHGAGYTVRRHSSSTDSNYFYSATRVGDMIIRSAVPYSVSLSNLLEADRGFLWFMAFVTVGMSFLAWFATRSIGNAVSRLTAFARRAENGERIYDDDPFPRGELGEISRHIVMLYAQRERQHEEALRQEREKIRIKKQLTNNINHELKTPLAAMQVCLETLMSHPELAPEKKEMFVKRCYDNSERLRALLADVSTLTRLDDGCDMIATETVPLTRIVCDCVHMFSLPDFIPIEVDMPESVYVTGNAALLSAIFNNLLHNANAYSQAKQIFISMKIEGNAIVIFFADNGIGIAQEHLPHIFERFYRVDKGRSRANGGTGLGLAIVKNAVLFHNGEITVSNRKEGGLCFRIAIPFDESLNR